MKPKLYKWDEIKDSFRHGLLLGNGASIAIDPRFSYKVLYKEVCGYSSLSEEIIALFRHYKTADFEFVLRALLETGEINRLLEIQENKTESHYLELRRALVRTIRRVHPLHNEVKSIFPNVTSFMKRFHTVVNLNYDLLVYWAMLSFNETAGSWFKDCFIHGTFEKDFNYLARPYNAGGATLVFYPHGSLFLATEPFGGEVKVTTAENDYLLESILSKWEGNNYIPLFVSEGSSKKKMLSITRNNYLNTLLSKTI